jgi:hypothetical protein
MTTNSKDNHKFHEEITQEAKYICEIVLSRSVPQDSVEAFSGSSPAGYPAAVAKLIEDQNVLFTKYRYCTSVKLGGEAKPTWQHGNSIDTHFGLVTPKAMFTPNVFSFSTGASWC